MRVLERVAIIGSGEVGQILATDLRAAGVRDIGAWDILFSDSHSVPSRALQLQTARATTSAIDAASGAELVICAVTAAQDLPAVRAARTGLTPDTFFLDLNSVSPAIRQQAAALVESQEVRYVEAAVMSPISPKRIASPMLLGGPHASAFLPLARSLGFAGAQVCSPKVGVASAAKMCRSVMIKGMEALLTESMLAARSYGVEDRSYGVEDEVLTSLRDLFPGRDWNAFARYMISRSLQHSRRRAEEMDEVSRTISAAGIEPWMSSACAARQDWAGSYAQVADSERLEDLLDRILASIGTSRGTSGC
jgi:3-hydroxyisobutyrate dehydrogenase-like beta-hydroxyacid dehydrogenase